MFLVLGEYLIGKQMGAAVLERIISQDNKIGGSVVEVCHKMTKK